MDKPSVLRPYTPGGHALITAAWLVALLDLGWAAVALVFEAPLWAGAFALFAAVLIAGGLGAYLYRHSRFLRTLASAEAALRSGDLARARRIVAPLLARFPEVALVQRASADVLYASGDPHSAASLYERAAKRLSRDVDVAVGLVASYAALGKGGDARRAASLVPGAIDVRLALAWSELVALGGDRDHGAALVRVLASEIDAASGAERNAMVAALVAIAAAQHGDREGARAALAAAERQHAVLEPADRAFIGYLGGVALSKAGATEDAIRTFELAMAAAPDTIGEALARRERSRLLG